MRVYFRLHCDPRPVLGYLPQQAGNFGMRAKELEGPTVTASSPVKKDEF